jgi:hypothetical protein
MGRVRSACASEGGRKSMVVAPGSRVRHRAGLVAVRSRAMADGDVDVADQQVELAGARPALVDVGLAELDRQVERAGEGRRHDDQRQAVPRAGGERLGRVAGDFRVVLEAQAARAEERVDEGTPRACSTTACSRRRRSRSGPMPCSR